MATKSQAKKWVQSKRPHSEFPNILLNEWVLVSKRDYAIAKRLAQTHPGMLKALLHKPIER